MTDFLAWVEFEQDEDDARKYEAFDAETAALYHAEHFDRDDHSIASGCDTVILVRPATGGPVERFRVTGEYEPVYYATPEV